MYSRIRLAANKTFSTISVSRRVSSRASTDTSSLSHHNSLEEILRKNGPRLSVPSLLQQRVDSGHAVTLPELRSITNRLIKSNRHDLALQVRKSLPLPNNNDIGYIKFRFFFFSFKRKSLDFSFLVQKKKSLDFCQ